MASSSHGQGLRGTVALAARVEEEEEESLEKHYPAKHEKRTSACDKTDARQTKPLLYTASSGFAAPQARSLHSLLEPSLVRPKGLIIKM